MKKPTTISRLVKHAIVIDTDALDRMLDSVSRYHCLSSLSVEDSCSDGSTVPFDSISDLADFENHRYRKIDSLELGLGTIDDYFRMNIGGSTNKYSTVYISNHDDDRAVQIADELTRRLKLCKPRYSIFTRLSFMEYLSIAMISVGISLFFFRIFRDGALDPMSVEDAVTAFYLFLPIIPLALGLNKAWEWLFPRSWFSIGRQKTEYAKRSKVRLWLVPGIPSALLLTILGRSFAGLINT